MKIVNFVSTKKITVMDSLEKRDFIHNHLHQVDENLLNEVYEKLHFYINEERMSDKLMDALNKGIESLDQGRGSSHEAVMERMRKKYPKLIK